MSFPAFGKNFSRTWDKPAISWISCEFAAVSWWICYVREKKYSLWTYFNFPIIDWVTFWRSYENLNNIFLVKRIVALSIGGNNLRVNVIPAHEQTFFIMAKGCSSWWVWNSLCVFQKKADCCVWAKGHINWWNKTYQNCNRKKREDFHSNDDKT